MCKCQATQIQSSQATCKQLVVFHHVSVKLQLSCTVLINCYSCQEAYCITGIIRRRKLSRITFFAIVHKKTFAIQAISYIKIPAKIKSARKHSQMLPDSRNSRNFSSTDDSRYTVSDFFKLYNKEIKRIVKI